MKRRNDENEIEIELGNPSDTQILASKTIISEKEQGFLRDMAKSRTGAGNTQMSLKYLLGPESTNC